MSNQDDIQARIELCNTLNQIRRQSQLLPNPQVRTELQTSPYNGKYTPLQIDMRRKAEILKYSPNTQSNQTNNTTKKHNLAQILSGKKMNRASYYKNTSMTTIDCPNDDLIPTPTSSSNIPGPIIQLIYDESVPLYNYRLNNTMNN